VFFNTNGAKRTLESSAELEIRSVFTSYYSVVLGVSKHKLAANEPQHLNSLLVNTPIFSSLSDYYFARICRCLCKAASPIRSISCAVHDL